MGMFFNNDDECYDDDHSYFMHFEDWEDPDTLEYYNYKFRNR